jgi:CheY-like chemotaxis protein
MGIGMLMNASGQRSVLIVEDDDDLRSALEMLLDDDGFEVSSAEHGAVALRLLETIEPDVILLDLNMPVMDGETFARRYRSQYGPEVPIVICTTSPPPSIIERIGNASLLRKPIELDHLLETVHHLSSEGSR